MTPHSQASVLALVIGGLSALSVGYNSAQASFSDTAPEAALAVSAAPAAQAAQAAQSQRSTASRSSGEIPSIKDVLGHESGTVISSPAQIKTYFDALAEAAPDRFQMTQYAKSWEGRPLVYAVIGSPENIKRLDKIKADLGKLGSGSVSASERRRIVSNTPAVVWLSHSVHGDEITPADSALRLAHHLLTETDDPLVKKIFENTIVIIDPAQNPDGRNRFVQHQQATLGLAPAEDPQSATHNQPWPRGRYNHYLFDLNRDWFALTQPETKGKVAAMLDWHPVVHVDAHEMSGNSTFFFPPSARPFNPNVTDGQVEKQDVIGKTIGARFDQRGIDYFTREVYDAFYPGYGDMWPTLGGAIGMTFEQASPRGMMYRRSDGTLLTYEMGVEQHFQAALGTIDAVASNKEMFLSDYAAYRSNGIRERRDDEDRYYLLDRAEHRYEADQLARQLAAQGISVAMTGAGVSVCGTQYADGAYVVDGAQPQAGLIRSLLDRQTDLPPAYLEEQKERRAAGLRPQLYDIIAWSVPLTSGVEVETCGSVDVQTSPIQASTPIPSLTEGLANANFGVAVPWTDGGQARLVIAALQEGYEARVIHDAFSTGGKDFPRGTVVFTAAKNGEGAVPKIRSLAEEIGAEVFGLSESWTDSGPNYGSGRNARLVEPKIAILWGEGTSALDTGAARFTLERDLGLPTVPIRPASIGRADLSGYDVLVVPEGSGLSGALGGRGKEAIKSFAEGGGVVVAFGNSLSMLSGDDGIFTVKEEKAVREGGTDHDADGPVDGRIIGSDDDYLDSMIHRHGPLDEPPGSIVKLVADEEHWLSAGYTDAYIPFEESVTYAPLGLNEGANVFRMAPAEELVASGYIWEENVAQMAYKPVIIQQSVGGGMGIGFASSPVTRSYLPGLDLVLANAVVIAPGHSR